MPYVRIKPLNLSLGYKLRSFSSRDGLRLAMGEDTENPRWYECTGPQAKYLATQRTNPRDPGSPCKFDILPDKPSADAFVRAEKASRNKQDEGTSLDRAIPLSDEVRSRNAAQESELERLRARVAELEAGRGIKSTDLESEYAAEELNDAPAPIGDTVTDPEAEPSSKPTTITSAFTNPAKRAVVKK